MTPNIGRTMTTGAETETVPRGSPTLLPTPPEGAPPHWPASTPWPTPGRRPAAGISNTGAPAAVGCGRQRPFPGAPDGDGGQDDGHCAHAPSITTTLPDFGLSLAGNCSAESKSSKLLHALPYRSEELLKESIL